MNHADHNIKITKKLIDTQSKAEKNKIMQKRHLPIVKLISRYANKNQPLLDLGCREGNLIKLLSNEGFKNLYGVDVSKYAIDILKSNNFKGEVADAQNLSLGRLFNTIIVSHMLEHCPKIQKVVTNIYNHLEKSGLVYVEVPRQPKMEMPTKAGHYHHFDELTELLDLFPKKQWRLLYVVYERGGNKGIIKTLFRKV